MELTASELWSGVLEGARPTLPAQSFVTWLSATHAVTLTESELVVQVPTAFHVEWVADKYGALLERLARKRLGLEIRIVFREDPEGPGPIPTPADEVSPEPLYAPRRPRVNGADDFPTPNLNRRYTFERFVVGDNSEFAWAACRAVAERPGRAYNPLFIYGGVGLGKTHLMQAIGNHLLSQGEGHRVAYVPSEQFVNELVMAIRTGTTAEFRQRYRKIDLLLVDDVHFIGGKESTQDEFFHTFNALYDAQKQIVLATDRPPKDLAGVEERLISRFEWGLVTDIRVPDYETRIAILKKKAEDDGVDLGDDVLDCVARECSSSVRQLEGAIIKLLAYSSLTHREVTVPLAQRALREALSRERYETERALTPERIRDRTAEAWGVTGSALASPRRTRNLTVPRQVAMYLIRELLELPFARIGETFGGRDHSTVIHSIRKVSEGREEEPELSARIDELQTELAARP